MRSYHFVAVLAALCLAVNASAQTPITVNNFSFESPGFDPNYPVITATGWFSSGGNNYIDNAPSLVTDGSVYQQLGSDMSQNTGVAVTPGGIYRLEFDYVSFPAGAATPLATVGLYANPDSVNDGLDAGNTELLFAELPATPGSTVLPQNLTSTIAAPASGFLYIQFTAGLNYRGLDNVRLTLEPAADADFDGDDDVDGADFLIWQRNVATPSPTQAQGNANADSVVDGADLAIWEQQFGSSVAAASVPEPTSAMLLVGGGALVFWIARRRS